MADHSSTGDDSCKPLTSLTRRELIKSIGGLAAGAFASTLLPSNVRRALANPMDRPASIRDIKHVVLLMQENRSFDHYFGTLSGVRGYDDPNAMTLPNGKPVFYQPDPKNPDGFLLPFHLDTRTTSAQRIPSTSHSWTAMHESWNHGKMDNWMPAHRKADGDKHAPYIMGYYTRNDIPFQFALAEAFTICDAYHASVLDNTYINRMYWMTGTCDPQGKAGGPMNFSRPKDGFRWTTYPERLEKAGISWKVYRGIDDYNMDMLTYFKQFKQAGKRSALYQRGVARSPVGQFEHDAINDNLPTVSWIIPNKHESEHPDHMPAVGAAYVASKIDAIAANPEVWAKTAFILDFDENDGLFDHVAPPTPAPGTPDEFIHGQPIGAGYRLPCIIVSPWTAGGWVCGEPFDHTSTLQFLEKVTGVKEPNISRWRRDTFGDMTSVFRFAGQRAPRPVLPDTAGRLDLAKYEAAHLPRPTLPGTNQSMPVQEPGTRKRIPSA